jgi:hypothetical protein
VPALFFHPAGDAWNGEVIFWIHSQGKQTTLNGEGRPRREIVGLVERGYSVMAIDPLLTGESTEDGVAVSAAPVVREGFSGYTYGYNRTLFAKRVHDVLTAVAFVIDTPKWEVEKVHLVGIDPGGGVLNVVPSPSWARRLRDWMGCVSAMLRESTIPGLFPAR